MSKHAKASSTTDKTRLTPNSPTILARTAVDAALDKKATNIAVMEMREVSGVADYFIICTGTSDLQIRAISDAIQYEIQHQHGERAWHREGEEHYSWVVLDYVDVVIHIMDAEKRGYYQLERLWGDAKIEFVTDDASSSDVELLEEVLASNVPFQKN